MKVANYFLGYRMPEYIEGPGSIRRLPEFMREKGAKKVLVVTDANLLKLGLLEVDGHAPSVAMQVLALAVVIGEEVGGVEGDLGLESVHVAALPSAMAE